MIPPNGQWKVHIEQRAWDRMYVDLFIFRDTPDDPANTRMLYIENTTDWILREEVVSALISSEKVRPSLRLPRDVVSALMPALLANGIKPPDDGKLAGLYEAQSKHLADLQNVITLLLNEVKIHADKFKESE